MKLLKASTLRPGFLVSLKTSCTGNAHYAVTDIERERVSRDGKLRAKWETEKTVEDPAEYDTARKVQSNASNLIRAVCAKSAFGLLCPEDMVDDLERAIAQAREMTDDFNQTARLTKVKVYVIAGRIAPTDAEAVKAINSEVRDLLADMERGVKNLDVKIIRESANRAKQLGSMLTPEAETRMQMAINAVRSTARRIVKSGEEAAQEVDRLALRRIRDARTTFIDLDDAAPVQAPKVKGRAVDLDPEDRFATAAVSSRKAPRRAAEV